MFLQAGAIGCRVDAPLNQQPQPGSLLHGGGQVLQLGFPVVVQFAAAGGEVHGLEVLAAANQAGEQAEGRSDRPGQQIGEGAGDHAAEAELWIVDVTTHRYREVYDPVAVREQGDAQAQGQVQGLVARHSITQFELLDHDPVVPLQPGVLQAVAQRGIQGPALNRVAGVGTRVGLAVPVRVTGA